jgi:hypothetical protein
MAARRSLLKSPPAVALIVWLGFALLVNLFEFPYQTDPPQRIDFHPDAPEQRFYDQAYLERERQKEEQYTAVARRAARIYGIEEMVGGFVRNYGLEHAHVLEVGAGSGLLQDQVEDYTALDISATARRYFHKPFVQADARAERNAQGPEARRNASPFPCMDGIPVCSFGISRTFVQGFRSRGQSREGKSVYSGFASVQSAFHAPGESNPANELEGHKPADCFSLPQVDSELRTILGTRQRCRQFNGYVRSLSVVQKPRRPLYELFG